MWKINILICAWIVLCCSAKKRRCSDCSLVSKCPEINTLDDMLTEDTTKVIQNAFCGMERVEGNKKKPKICCSAILQPEPVLPPVQPIAPNNIITRFFIQPGLELLPKDCGRIDGGRIVGGIIANLREFPWMALLMINSRSAQHERDYFVCGGTIISKRYILTAGHCVRNKKITKIRVGEFQIGKRTDVQGEPPVLDTEDHLQDIDVEEVICHENYDKATKIDDIALIRVKEDIDFTHRNVAPICLPVQEELRNITLGMRMATVAGWGITETKKRSDILLKVDIPIYPEATCRQSLNEYNDIKKICAGSVGKDSCRGDSGGPLMLEEDVNQMIKMVQYGVVSYGPNDCASYSPGVYTDVTKYMDWILEHLKP